MDGNALQKQEAKVSCFFCMKILKKGEENMEPKQELKELFENPVVGNYVNIVRMQMIKERSFEYRLPRFTTPQDVVDMTHTFFEGCDREMTAVISLNGNGTPIAFQIIGVGTVNACIMSARDIFKHALLSNAINVIILHNHPSGIPTPSKEDVTVTKKIKEAGTMLGIELLDHIIIGNRENFTSLKEQGLC